MARTAMKTNTKYVSYYRSSGKADYIWRDEKKYGKDENGRTLRDHRYVRRRGYYNHGLYAYEAYYIDFNGKEQFYCALHLPLDYGKQFAKRDNLMTRLLQIKPNANPDILKKIQFRPIMEVK